MAKGKSYSYNFGIALSGGGARGFAHLGVLKALEEQNFKPEIISGTSVGSLIAVLYADGYTADEIREIGSNLSFTSIVEGIIPRGGFFKTSRIEHLLKTYLHATNFEDLKIPVEVVASDIESGKLRVFSKGPIAQAVMASCTVPVIFSPVRIDEHYYVDGGLLMNFPVSIIRKKCKRVLGVNISPITSMKYTESIKYVIERSMNYMVGANSTAEAELCDYLIESEEFSRYSIFDFKHAAKIHHLGYELTCQYLEKHKEKMLRDLYGKEPKKGLGKWFRR
ncbi:phospholipase [Bacteroides sp. 214]|nr:phospholipase [Bacteroides sp. 214]